MPHQQAIVTASGNLVGPPVVDSVKDGTLPRSRFSIGINGAREGEVCFLDCVALGGTLTDVLKGAEKGMPIAVFGRLSQSKYEKDGRRQSRITVIATHVSIIPKSSMKSADAITDAALTETQPKDFTPPGLL